MAKPSKKLVAAEMTPDELRARLREQREELFQLRFRHATAPMKNPHVIRAARKNIARALTALRAKGGAA